MSQSCTALLWGWAGERECAGELQGVWRHPERGDVVVYALPTHEDGSNAYWAFRVPPDWAARDVRALVTSPQGEVLALDEPLQLAPYGFPAPNRSRMDAIPLIDFQSTLGPAEVELPLRGRLYGLVELVNYRDEIIHEVYGYDIGRRQWVQLTTVNLGAFDVVPGRVVGGILMSPLALTLDVAAITGFVCLAIASRGKGLGSFHVHGFDGDDSAEPPTFWQRDEYWQSVGAAAAPVR